MLLAPGPEALRPETAAIAEYLPTVVGPHTTECEAQTILRCLAREAAVFEQHRLCRGVDLAGELVHGAGRLVICERQQGVEHRIAEAKRIGAFAGRALVRGHASLAEAADRQG